MSINQILVAAMLFISLSSKASNESLVIEKSFHLPISEMSGMCWRNHPENKKLELLIVGDKGHSLFVLDWPILNKPIVKEIDLTKIAPEFSAKGSQWESVTSDATGKIFILQESPARIFVISSDLKKLESILELNVKGKEWGDVAWGNDPNSQGEGIILLKNGHILVVKEKKPLKILAFAPNGQKAQGLKDQIGLEGSFTFPISGQRHITYELAAFWTVPKAPEDSSGINLDPDARAYILSDVSASIHRLEIPAAVGAGDLALTQNWKLPPAIIKPEGMVIDTKFRPIISIDQKKPKGDNLFILSSMREK